MNNKSEQRAFISTAIYDHPKIGQELRSDTSKYLVIYASPGSATNYYGAVLENDATSELIVVNKGTEPSNIHDIQADIAMIAMNMPSQWPEAANTMRWALDYAKQHNIPTSQISITGHSLGGALAQLQASMPEAAGIHAETFNAYGALSMARSLHANLDPASAADRVVNHRMYHDPVSAVSKHVGRTVDYMDRDDYERHRQGGSALLGEPKAILASHTVSNFWNQANNQPGNVFAHNYMKEFHHRPLDDLPPGVPLDLSIPFHLLGERRPASAPPLAVDASVDEMHDYLCKAATYDDASFMEALRQIGKTDFAQTFHAEAARQVDMEDRINDLESQLQQAREQPLAQAQQISGPVMSR
ncbi:hypothetical protein P3W33_10875 [Luteibacter sp. PPL552]